MKTWIRRSLIGLAALAGLGAAAVAVGVQLADRKLARQIALPALAAPALQSDAASIDRGRYLYASRGCADCHGADGRGRTFIDDGHGLSVKAPNISPGPGGVVAAYRAEDWDRTIRHGVKPDGRPLFIMPSEDYNRFTDGDLAALVAYVRTLPPVAGSGLQAQVPVPLKVAYGIGLVRDAAEKIDHALPPAAPVPEGVTPEHGRYVANMCIGCHGAGLAGGPIPGGPPSWPAAANLTPGEGGVMARYPDPAAFRRMLETGRRPDGSVVQVMPFESLRALSATDSAALHAYLTTLPPRPAGSR